MYFAAGLIDYVEIRVHIIRNIHDIGDRGMRGVDRMMDSIRKGEIS